MSGVGGRRREVGRRGRGRVWSATKGPMAGCVLMALRRAGMDGESLVEWVWPELQVGSLTFEELFSHQGGLAGLNEKCSIWDREAVVLIPGDPT